MHHRHRDGATGILRFGFSMFAHMRLHLFRQETVVHTYSRQYRLREHSTHPEARVVLRTPFATRLAPWSEWTEIDFMLLDLGLSGLARIRRHSLAIGFLLDPSVDGGLGRNGYRVILVNGAHRTVAPLDPTPQR